MVGTRHVKPSCSTDELEGVMVVRLRVALEWGYRLWLAGLEQAVERARPDVLIVHGMTNFNSLRVVVAKVLRRLPSGCKIIFDDHMLFSASRGGLSRRLFYLFLSAFWGPILKRLQVRLVAVTEETKAFIQKNYGAHGDDIQVVQLGVDVGSFQRDALKGAQIRTQLGLSPEDYVIIQTGKIIPEKGQELLFKASLPLLRDANSTKLVFVGAGDPTFAKHLRELADSERVSSQVVWVPPVPHTALPGYYSAADVAVWPMQESMSVLDASACGLPVILRDTIVGKERTSNGRGRTFRTIEELTDLLEMLGRDKSLRNAMGSAGERFVKQNLDWDMIARSFIEV
jgi:glycosyltransferase involved in cell wall biosynthesis